MKKIYSFMVAAVALFSAASCNKEFTNEQENLPVDEVVTFEASVDGADTKAHLDGNVSKWDASDKITIHNGTTPYEFTTEDAGTTAKFTYVGNDFTGDKFMAVYPAGNWNADIEAKTVNAYIPTYQGVKAGSYNKDAALAVAYTEDNTLAFKNATALIKFVVEESNIKGIEFYGNDEEAITGNVLVSLNANNTVKTVEGLDTVFEEGEANEWTGKGTWVKCYSEEENWCFTAGQTYYAAIAPANFTNGVSVNFFYAADGGGENKVEKVKTTTNPINLAANTILDLGILKYEEPEVDASAYGLVGSFQGWNSTSPITMTNSEDGWIVAENVELYKDDEFKFVKDNSWDVSYGTSSVTVIEEGQEFAVETNNSQNMKVAKNGKFNVYLNPTTLKVKVECVEEYTDLTVNIDIDNKANWSPLYIYLKADGVAITPAEGALVSNNTYAVSGEYIGTSLTCKFISGTKVSEVMNIAITKNGATVTLEETIIKLKVQLNTDNAKQWWGNTMKIHVWNTDTSFDTSWPGTNMTSEGNYTWSIIVPSELVGKTINYLVHNGNGWQSSDATVTIAADGNTVTGSSIGIN